MKLAAFQFKASENIETNFEKLVSAINLATLENADFLLTQECALTGFPPVERKNTASIDFGELSKYETELFELATKNKLSIALGTIESANNSNFNTVKISHKNKSICSYKKRALWGWDCDNFSPGFDEGIFEIENIKIGIRICYEIRFPEYFRELFVSSVPICAISFADVSDNPDFDRYNLILAHLQTRAVENCIYIVSANSISKNQIAPTAIIDPNGKILSKAEINKEELISFDYKGQDISFGQKGRIQHSKELLKL
ncbi:carbon-nitrogen hydrolase family protein [Desulfospira joergensenii]|uniref:carbon-nitrogen hydrolase family protein n=1 Tax=Desulfospira joergensenii TaxID=53329 RepID=UPI0003B5A637|nr:carbon-nitrogen hydrolase family protein [Desulfospira joergensenii]